jgi:hypothetical protein
MAWETECVEILRVMIGDLAETPTYADERLQRILVVSALQVRQELTFVQNFVVSIEETDIAPDPADVATRDENFLNLICMKAACLIERAETRTAAGQAISIRDGSSAIDLRAQLTGRLALLKQGWCAVYEQAKIDYTTGQSGITVGAVIMGPVRQLATRGDLPFNTNVASDNRSYFR